MLGSNVRRLTDDEWATAKAPFSFLRVTNNDWGPKHRLIISKWLDDLPGDGWFYETGESASFQRSEDALAYRIWISDDPFQIEPYRLREHVADVIAMFEAS